MSRFYVGRKIFFSVISLVMFLSWFTLEHFCITRSNWWQRSPFIDKMTNSYLQGRYFLESQHLICILN